MNRFLLLSGSECPEAVLSDGAVYLPTFSHLLIVNKLSLSTAAVNMSSMSKHKPSFILLHCVVSQCLSMYTVLIPSGIDSIWTTRVPVKVLKGAQTWAAAAGTLPSSSSFSSWSLRVVLVTNDVLDGSLTLRLCPSYFSSISSAHLRVHPLHVHRLEGLPYHLSNRYHFYSFPTT